MPATNTREEETMLHAHHGKKLNAYRLAIRLHSKEHLIETIILIPTKTPLGKHRILAVSLQKSEHGC